MVNIRVGAASAALLVWAFSCVHVARACEPYGLPPDLSIHQATLRFLENPSVQQPIDVKRLDYGVITQTLFHVTNQVRAKRKRNPVKYHAKLAQAACLHAQDMAIRGKLGHINSQNITFRTPYDRVSAIGFVANSVSENIAEMPVIQYKSGKTFYTRTENTHTIVSYTPNGPPIERHTYLGFAQSLLDQWMDSRGHRHNILSDKAEFTGTACHYAGAKPDIDVLYCVQLFAN